MQSIDARKEYKNSFECAAKMVKNEGFFTLWSGAVPRLARLILSGGIVFTMYALSLLVNGHLLTFDHRYEKTMEGLDRLDPERQYI